VVLPKVVASHTSFFQNCWRILFIMYFLIFTAKFILHFSWIVCCALKLNLFFFIYKQIFYWKEY
jgi:hypothetical protein